MFKNLLNLSYNRTLLEALGFYVAYLLCFVLMGSIIGYLIGVTTLSEPNTAKVLDHVSMATKTITYIVSLILAFTILIKKRIMDNFLFMIIAFVSGILTIYTGASGGLILIAFLTTRKSTT